MRRGHFRRVYERSPSDEHIARASIGAGRLVPDLKRADLSAAYFLHEKLKPVFGPEKLYYANYSQSSNPNAFPVLMADGRVESSESVSEVIRNLPLTNINYIYAAPSLVPDVKNWIEKIANRYSREVSHDEHR